ncbi:MULTISPECIES: LacI family DNA-binding transcriptional regulator [Streptomyces]|uniref:LacI family transcriptional regulator n=1 Tax=Streptomyces cinereoruber TaxID=67260 RepID=A0ABX6B8G0_9ACTN|nr:MULTISPECIES: LacI family DNA-binding transcriptional regulator [Streptomyces]MBY8820174.1 LacI family transcriptional regulator [Streptomyces cinereoruber]PVC68413.1 LacI family transcriptional regulator [Streptomyces sp. CS081A]QEV31494.1 LacI family transcriptional regulator [Streptomyces cinereoruber]
MGNRVPTLEDVAREAGVSRATVSRVVNGVRNVSPDIQRSVRDAIARTGYTPNQAARSLVTRRTGAAALVLSATDGAFAARVFSDPFFGRVVDGVLPVLRERAIQPVLLVAESERARTQLVEYLRRGAADGALVVPLDDADPLPAMLAAAGLPTVLFGRPRDGERYGFVDLDNDAGARLAAEHLWATGRRRPATIAAPVTAPAAAARLDGFRRALAARGVTDVPVVRGRFTVDSGRRAMAELLRDHPDVDAVFAANDMMAEGACQYLRERGVDVPGTVAVVGFDDSAAARRSHPRLTTVRQPVEHMAAALAGLLVEELEGLRPGPASRVFEPVLVVRESA